MISSSDPPSASSADQPNKRVAASFQNVIVPAASAITTASAS